MKKEIRAAVRFSRQEYFILKEKSKQAGVKVSEFLRDSAFRSRIVPRLSEEERGFIRHLIGMSANINQVARACHREGVFEAAQFFERYRSEMDAVLVKLKP